ncbi:MAG: tyrosine--tRNA ligase [Solirubrobacterales bacterium]
MPDLPDSTAESHAGAAGLTLGAVDVLPAAGLEELLATGASLRVKLGIDPTAPDIHLGHVVVLEKLRQFQAAGHKAVLIIGDYTARVGDPSGRSSERPVLSAEQIEVNARTFQEQAFKVLDPQATEVRFNSEWLEMPSAELFGLARRFTVARLLERDDFTRRMAAAEPISMLELLYPVLQGYDSVAVEADLELGGTEQKFNLLFGRDVQASFGQRPQLVMTLPILPGTDGVRKMSKSLDNYVGVTEAPAEIFGKLMSIPDTALATYWLLLLGAEIDDGVGPLEAKRELARRICDRFAGPGAGEEAAARFDLVHRAREIPTDIPAHELGTADPVHLPNLLREGLGLSGSEARRLIEQGAVRLDGEAIDPDRLDVRRAELTGRVLQIGKRRFLKLT